VSDDNKVAKELVETLKDGERGFAPDHRRIDHWRSSA